MVKGLARRCRARRWAAVHGSGDFSARHGCSRILAPHTGHRASAKDRSDAASCRTFACVSTTMSEHSSRFDDTAWSGFGTAQTAAEFCTHWLALQCLQIGEVRSGLLLLAREGGGPFARAAQWPSAGGNVEPLGLAAERCLAEHRGLILRGLANALVVLAYPVDVDGNLEGAVVLDVAEREDDALQSALRQIHWGIGWLTTLLLRRRTADQSLVAQRAREAIDVLALAGEQTGLRALAMAVVNDLASRFLCNRVAFGVERKGRARLLALSHSAFFEKKSHFVVALENAMDEALNQRGMVCVPPLDEEQQAVAIAHRDFAASRAICSVVVERAGVGIGVITLERERPFDAEDLRAFQVVAALIGPLLETRIRLDQWLAGRVRDRIQDAWRHLRDPRRPGFRFALVVVAVAFSLIFVDTDYHVPAKAVVEGAVQRAVVAPFDGFVRDAPVRAGFLVRQGQVLATLDERDLLVERRRWLAEREQHGARYRDGLAKHERAGANVALAQMQQAEAQLALTEEKLARAQIVAPFDGLVVAGDLSQLLGSPVEQGRQLFEVAPLDAYRVILKVEDRDIRDVRAGQSGKLILAGLPGELLDFEVRNISLAEADEGKNVFRVEAQLARSDLKLRPGMEGVGKINAGEQTFAWIWTHRLTDWLRLQAWKWLP